MSRSDMILRVRDLVNEDVANWWSDATIIGSLEEGIRFIASFTQAIQTVVAGVTVAGDRKVNVSGAKTCFVEYDEIGRASCRERV